jgi:endonuclease/exonuclease/phosphatase family metal-dependent hydrolase
MPLNARLMRCILLLMLLLHPTITLAAELKLATWNLEWLTNRAAGDPRLPPDAHPRQPEDFDLLRGYVNELAADVIGIQEVDGSPAAARVFPPERYSIHMTRDHVVQRVGVAVRRGLHYTVNPDVAGFDIDPGRQLRSGADITLDLPKGSLRVLVVHLKTGCFDGSLSRTKRRVCIELREQVPPLRDWIAARQTEGVPFAVLGDFNRHMDGRDELWATLRQAAPLVRVTEGHASPCWGGESFIDHILLGGAARDWLVPDSLRVTVYRESGDTWKDRLSDHCPVSVRLRVPD